jgi:predicted AlkP superfamily pyrophosphatase or phosphodiesterase
MKNKLFIFTILLASLTGTTSWAQRVKHVVLISIDGLRPDFYLDPSWGTVNLKQMMKKGVYAKAVTSVFPSYTYPSHTTMVTGALPIHHGIYYNSPFIPADTPGRWYWNESDIKTETLWDAVHKAGLKSAAITWPVTVGAPIDYNIPETWTWPNGSADDRLQASSKQATPAGLFEELQANATGKLQPNDYNLNSLAMDENIARMGAYLFRTYKPNLLALHLACVDHAEHEEGRDGDGVRRAVAGADRAVKTLLEAIEKAGLKDSTAVIVLGDHGHFDIHTSLQPNIWLKENGFTLPGAKDKKWKAMFHAAGGSAFLHLENPKDSASLHKIRNLLNSLPAAQKKLFRIIERPELDQLGADPRVPLALAGIDGVVFSATDKGPSIKPAHGGTHGFVQNMPGIETGFIGYGAGFNKGTVIPLMGLEDIAPLVSALLGLDFKAPDGILYPGLIK